MEEIEMQRCWVLIIILSRIGDGVTDGDGLYFDLPATHCLMISSEGCEGIPRGELY